jgi:hypothetical protein
MITGKFYHHWSEARAKGMNLLDVDPRLKVAQRRFAGLDRYVGGLSDEELRLMQSAEEIGTARAFSMSEASQVPRAFAVYSGQLAMLESLRLATDQHSDTGSIFTEAVLYPAASQLRGKDACAAIRIQVTENSSKGGGSALAKAASKEVRAFVDIENFKAFTSLPCQFDFRNGAAQPWARKLFRKGLAALKRSDDFEGPIQLMMDADLRRKLVAFLLFPQFAAKPRAKVARLESLFAEHQVKVRATNVKDLFERMHIVELKPPPRVRKKSRQSRSK